MDITFLGGAEEIGASCAVLDMDGERLLIDCGQRMNAPPGQSLPDFSFLENGPPISAVLITHAHADHIGALPALEPFLSTDCPIYATEPTIAITRVMLEDTLRIMNQFRQGDGELGLFPAINVRGALQRFQSVRWGKSIRLARSSLHATWFPAGHILGAAMIEVRGADESVLFSGDISVSEQLSVPGVFVPAIRPDILVLESTYGSRLHAHRPAQEKRIVERVRSANAEGGHVLFPTFALGRAQEVLLILGRAMRDGSLPQIPVYADGLVRAVSKVYSRFPDDLSQGCRQLWEQGLDPIFPEDLPIAAIRNNDHREAVAVGHPCVVVASSGMLQGGASQFYAKQWVGDSRNLILVTGYQDEESPGQALLNLVAQPRESTRYYKLGGVRTEVACQVESCQLSAHADNGELSAVAAKLKPSLILPVHGDGGAREGLAKTLMTVSRGEVILPSNGETYSAQGDKWSTGRRSPSVRPNPLSFWPPWDPQSPRELDLARFHSWLAEQTPPIAWITLDELAEIWRSPETPTPDDWDQLRMAIYSEPQPYFMPDARRPYLLKLTPLENLKEAESKEQPRPVEWTVSLLRSLFPAESGLLRYGFFPEEQEVQLEFRFPLAAHQRYVRRIGELREKSGWHPKIVGQTRASDLMALVTEWHPSANPDAMEVEIESATMRVSINDLLEHGEVEEFTERFERKTGFHLHLTLASAPRSSES